MIKKETSVMILNREDLHGDKKNKSFHSIMSNDFDILVSRASHECGVVLFIDDDGNTKILKNRYGYEGFICKQLV